MLDVTCYVEQRYPIFVISIERAARIRTVGVKDAGLEATGVKVARNCANPTRTPAPTGLFKSFNNTLHSKFSCW
jgi:hypothetical protein